LGSFFFAMAELDPLFWDEEELGKEDDGDEDAAPVLAKKRVILHSSVL